MLKPGKRQLKDITDQELQVIVEMSHHYGCKNFWGNPVITDIDRNMFDNTIVIDYEQTRIEDGEKSLTVMFFEYNSLTYHVDYRYPYARSTKSESITEDPKMLLWLLNQDFDLLSVLSEKPTAIHLSQSYKTMGFLVGHGHCGYFKMDTMKFFGPDERDKANEYQDERKQEKDYVHIFQVLDVNERDADFRLEGQALRAHGALHRHRARQGKRRTIQSLPQRLMLQRVHPRMGRPRSQRLCKAVGRDRPDDILRSDTKRLRGYRPSLGCPH